MFRNLFLSARLAGFAVAASLGLAVQTEASTVDFVVDLAGSSVTLSDASGGGLLCGLSNCGVSATLASSLNDGDTYTIGTGDTASFDFLTFTGHGTTGLTPRSFLVSAVLAFSSPNLAISGNGSAGAFLLLGYITGGNLTWNSIVPQNVTLPGGSEVAFNFEGGSGLFLGHDVTTHASITGTNIVAAVPLPAGGLLLLGAMGGLAALRRRKANLAA